MGSETTGRIPMVDRSTSALLTERVAQDPDARLFAIPDSFGGWFDLTAAEFHDRVRALAKGFLFSGLEPGDRVGVLCSNRFDATLVDFATALVGVAVVPLRRQASQAELLDVLGDSEVVAMVVETADDFARFDEVHSDLPLVANVWQVALGSLDKLALRGREIGDSALDARSAAVSPETVLAVYYSSGEGGALLRHVLTHGGLAARARAFADVVEEATGPGASTLLVLPATDATTRLTTLTSVVTGTRLGHLADPGALLATLATFRPTLLVAPPETFEGIEEAAERRAEVAGRGTALRQALEVALEYSEALGRGTLNRGLKTRFALADTLVLRGVRKTAGGRLRFGVSVVSTHALTPRLRHVMRALDLRSLEAFGAPETSGLALIERFDDPYDRLTGTVGIPLAGLDVSLAEDGSVRMRGLGVSVADNSVADNSVADTTSAASAQDDGWVDLGVGGSFDDEGRLVLDATDLPGEREDPAFHPLDDDETAAARD